MDPRLNGVAGKAKAAVSRHALPWAYLLIATFLVFYYGSSLVLVFRHLNSADNIKLWLPTLVIPTGIGFEFFAPWRLGPIAAPLWHAYFAGIVGLALLIAWRRRRSARRYAPPVMGVVSLFLLTSAVGFLSTSIQDQDLTGRALPTGSLAMTYSAGSESAWRNSSVWMAPTVVVAPGSAPNRLVFGLNAAEDRRPAFTLWATGVHHEFEAVGRSCEKTRIVRRSSPVVATGFWCRVAPVENRRTAGLVEWLPPTEAPVLVDLKGSGPIYYWSHDAGENGLLQQVGISAYLGGHAGTFKGTRERPIDTLPVRPGWVGVTYQAGIDGSPAAAVIGSGDGDMLSLGVAYYQRPNELVHGIRQGEAEQQGGLLLFYGDQQKHSRTWVAGWLVRDRRGARGEAFAETVALIIVGAIPVVSFSGARRRRGTA